MNSSDKVQHEIIWYNSFFQLKVRLSLMVVYTYMNWYTLRCFYIQLTRRTLICIIYQSLILESIWALRYIRNNLREGERVVDW